MASIQTVRSMTRDADAVFGLKRHSINGLSNKRQGDVDHRLVPRFHSESIAHKTVFNRKYSSIREGKKDGLAADHQWDPGDT